MDADSKISFPKVFVGVAPAAELIRTAIGLFDRQSSKSLTS